ncbi:MAG: tRNA (adenosine(37)-N6)-threonylcarbamoyltransferase complex ATPase subunit type 1 TsaE [Oligoflexales bacterium]|nr:tRNA (adenosine(37)-N6)-threonylcarbamoyltransferase complex ATPase subunit type 1 TsaE [Oligoflexales bacterium]
MKEKDTDKSSTDCLLIKEKESSLEQISAIAELLYEELMQDQKTFCLWLKGPLGAGKTSIVGAILRRIGLSEKVPVSSPTFSYLNDYKIKTDYFAHMDLYRLTGGSEEDFLSHKSYRGIFIEWPRPLDGFPEATHLLEIDYPYDGPKSNHRHYRFFRCTPTQN